MSLMTPTKPEPAISVQATHNVSIKNVANLLCAAFEGGSNYWYNIDKSHKPENFDNTPPADKQFTHISYPLNIGGHLVISVKEGVDEEMEGKTFILDLATITLGLWKMAEKSPDHFSNFITENEDSTTADVFLQYCIFGEVLYG